MFAEQADEGRALVAGWPWWAKRSKIPEFEKLLGALKRSTAGQGAERKRRVERVGECASARVRECAT